MNDIQVEEHKTATIYVPEAVGVFDSFKHLQGAFYDLRMVGFSRYDISLLAGQTVLEEKLGTEYWRASDLAHDPDAPRAAFCSQEGISELEGVIAGGFFIVGSFIALGTMLTPASPLAASISAIAIIGSPAAVIGTLLARRVGQDHQDYYANQIAHGGILLWVRVRDQDSEDLAVTILKGNSGREVHVHPWNE